MYKKPICTTIDTIKKKRATYIILSTIEWMNLAKKNNKDSIRAYHRGVKTACLTVWPNAVYIFRYYLEISIIDQKLVSLLSFANKAGHTLCLSLARTFTLSHTPLTWFCFALWKAIGHIQFILNLWRKKVSYLYLSVTEMSWHIAMIWFVLNGTTDGLIFEMLIWIFAKAKSIWCNVDILTIYWYCLAGESNW